MPIFVLMTGKVLIFSAPSGAGKSTVVRHLLSLHPEFEFSVSATSRAPRGEEKDGKDYHFISSDRFRELVSEGAFVEYEEVYKDVFYGTLKSEVERIWSRGHVILFDVDVKGGCTLKRWFGDVALSILIVPPSLEVLEKRLRGRATDSPEAIATRLDKARWELGFAKGRFDVELLNDDLDKALSEARGIVDGFLKK